MIRRREQPRNTKSASRRRNRSGRKTLGRWTGPRLESLEPRHLLTAVTLGNGNEPFIAVDPFNPENVVVGGNGLGAMFSTDRGETFTGPSFPANYSGDPGLAIDSNGQIFFSYLVPDAVIATDLDVGVSNTNFTLQNFAANQVVVSNPEDPADLNLGDDDDKEFIAADHFTTSPFRDNVYVAWRELNNEDLLFVRSTDNGATFSAPVSLATPVNNFLSGADPEVGPNGEVYVLYWDGSNIGGDVGEVRVVKSTDGGASFFNPVAGGGAVSFPAGTVGLDATGLDHNAGLMRNQPPNQNFRWDVRTMIDIEADPLRTGNVYAIWITDPDGTNMGDASNVLFSRSTNGGVSWSTPSILNDDGGSLTQHMPTIAVDEAGNLVAIWYDERLSTNVNDPNLAVFGSVSLDGGLTWSSNFLLQDSTFDPDSGGANTFIGDYIKVAAADGTAFAAWTQTDGAGTNQIMVEKFSILAAFQDRFEPNNSQANATVLGSEKKITLRDLTIHNEDDVDFFKITAQDTGKLIINAFFDDDIGDLDIVVVDANGNLLASSTSTTDNEMLVIPVVSQEMYFLRVTGFGDDQNHYDLEIENFAVPVPTAVHLDPASDTGMMRNDNYTADNTPRLVIQADLTNFANMGVIIRDAAGAAALLPGAAVEVSIVNSITGATITGIANPVGASTTLFEFTPTVPLLDGTYFASAAVRIFDGQRDGAGVLIDTSDRGQLSPPLWFTVDTTAPEPATKDLIESSDTGMLRDDNVTNKMQPAFAGVAEPNAKIRVLANGLTVGGGVVNNNGNWEVTVEPLADGEYNIAVQVEDLAGNITQSNGLTIWIDTTEPNTPLLDLVRAFDFGHSDTDNITNTGTPTFTVTANDTPNGGLNPFPNGIKYRIFDRPGNALGEILLVDSFTGLGGFTNGGFFAHTLSQMFNDDFDGVINGVPLADGVHNFKLEVEDRAGNISHDFLLNVEIDTVAPVANTPNLLDSSDTGMLNNDDVTNKMSPAFDGISEVNSAVRVYANGILVGQGVVASDNSDGVLGDDMGRWEVTVEPLADGQYNITVEIEDWAGNQSTSQALTIWIDTVEPNTPLLDLISDSGRHDDDEVTNTNTPIVTVTADDTPNGGLNPFPNDIKYRIYDRPGNALGEVLIVDSFTGLGGVFTTGGFFSHTLSRLLNDDFDGVINGLPLADGVHNLKLEVEDRAGNISHDFLLEITIDTVAPPVNVLKIDPGTSDTGVEGFPATFVDRVTSDTATGFIGRAEADSIVRLFVDGIANSAIDIPAEFSLTVAVPLDGNLAFPNGQWMTAFIHDLNDPNFFAFDGVREILVTAEDLAGNINLVNDGVGDAAQRLLAFIDTQGPQITNVFINNRNNPFDLFGLKPNQFLPPVGGPTPLVNSLVIDVRDLPLRSNADPNFLYNALLAGVANDPGHYHVRGDHSGIIAIQSVQFIPDATANGAAATGQIVLTFFEPLPDDRFTLTVSDLLVDPAGNRLDGESNADEPNEAPQFPSGDGQPGGDFVARFTVDSRPEIGTYCCGTVYIDINGNKVFDPEGQDNDQTNRDLVFNFGNSADALFAGQFTGGGLANGFDRLGAYGFDGGVYRFLLDLNDDGVADVSIPSAAQVNAAPIAGNFDGNAANGDEVGLFTGTQWFLDQVHANNVPAAPTIAGGNMRGYPIAGDFDGNGTDDLATFFGDRFFFDFNLDGNADAIINFGFAGVLDRPVAADLDQDGIDDIGLWVPGRSGVFPEEAGEFYFLMSDDLAGLKRVPGTVNTLNHPFSPVPLGVDMFAQFGDEFASPIVGNFDPPVAGGSSTEPLLPPVVDQSGWLQKLYSDVTGRGAGEHEVAYWNGKMAAGMNYQTVASSLLAGPEYRGKIIDEMYQEYLGRRAEAAGLSYWLDVWGKHGGPEIVKASLFGSAEYFANHGGNNTGFIHGLYQDVLGRTPAGFEVAYWQSVLRGASRTTVAMGFVTSNELRLGLIASWYQDFLGREADQASKTFWLNQLKLGIPQQQVLSNILGGREYGVV